MTRLSIIIPIYNAHLYIENCLLSLLKQVTLEDEIILINDGSQDNSLDICKQFVEKYPNVHLLSSKNLGPSHARNMGLEKASGKWVMFIDIDDDFSPNLVDSMICSISNYEMTVCGYELIKVEQDKKMNIFMKKQILHRNNFNQLVFNNSMLNTLWNKIYLLEVIRKNHIRFDEKVYRGEDLLFNLDYIGVIQNGIVINEEILYFYKLRNSGQNLRFKESLQPRFERVRKIQEKLLSINELNKMEVYVYCLRMYGRHIKTVMKNWIQKK